MDYYGRLTLAIFRASVDSVRQVLCTDHHTDNVLVGVFTTLRHRIWSASLLFDPESLFATWNDGKLHI